MHSSSFFHRKNLLFQTKKDNRYRMAGLGRRTHYRKHLTDSVLNDLPEPKDHERIAKVVSTRGLNQFDILVASNDSVDDRTPQLAILPTKFHKLVWVKRNDYVIVQTGDDASTDDDESGIRYIISHILYKDQVKHLQSKDLWPTNDLEFQHDAGAIDEETEAPKEEDDGIVYGDDYYDSDDLNDDDLFVNTNRLARLEIQDSSDSDRSDED
jgi:probable RNA-binding protein EIF1AD